MNIHENQEPTIDFEALVQNQPKTLLEADRDEVCGILRILKYQYNLTDKFEKELWDSWKAGRFYIVRFSEDRSDEAFMNGPAIRKMECFVPLSWGCFKAFCTIHENGEIRFLWVDNSASTFGLGKYFRENLTPIQP